MNESPVPMDHDVDVNIVPEDVNRSHQWFAYSNQLKVIGEYNLITAGNTTQSATTQYLSNYFRKRLKLNLKELDMLLIEFLSLYPYYYDIQEGFSGTITNELSTPSSQYPYLYQGTNEVSTPSSQYPYLYQGTNDFGFQMFPQVIPAGGGEQKGGTAYPNNITGYSDLMRLFNMNTNSNRNIFEVRNCALDTFHDFQKSNRQGIYPNDEMKKLLFNLILMNDPPCPTTEFYLKLSKFERRIMIDTILNPEKFNSPGLSDIHSENFNFLFTMPHDDISEEVSSTSPNMNSQDSTILMDLFTGKNFDRVKYIYLEAAHSSYYKSIENVMGYEQITSLSSVIDSKTSTSTFDERFLEWKLKNQANNFLKMHLISSEDVLHSTSVSYLRLLGVNANVEVYDVLYTNDPQIPEDKRNTSFYEDIYNVFHTNQALNVKYYAVITETNEIYALMDIYLPVIDNENNPHYYHLLKNGISVSDLTHGLEYIEKKKLSTSVNLTQQEGYKIADDMYNILSNNGTRTVAGFDWYDEIQRILINHKLEGDGGQIRCVDLLNKFSNDSGLIALVTGDQLAIWSCIIHGVPVIGNCFKHVASSSSVGNASSSVGNASSSAATTGESEASSSVATTEEKINFMLYYLPGKYNDLKFMINMKRTILNKLYNDLITLANEANQVPNEAKTIIDEIKDIPMMSDVLQLLNDAPPDETIKDILDNLSQASCADPPTDSLSDQTEDSLSDKEILDSIDKMLSKYSERVKDLMFKNKYKEQIDNVRDAFINGSGGLISQELKSVRSSRKKVDSITSLSTTSFKYHAIQQFANANFDKELNQEHYKNCVQLIRQKLQQVLGNDPLEDKIKICTIVLKEMITYYKSLTSPSTASVTPVDPTLTVHFLEYCLSDLYMLLTNTQFVSQVRQDAAADRLKDKNDNKIFKKIKDSIKKLNKTLVKFRGNTSSINGDPPVVGNADNNEECVIAEMEKIHTKLTSNTTNSGKRNFWTKMVTKWGDNLKELYGDNNKTKKRKRTESSGTTGTESSGTTDQEDNKRKKIKKRTKGGTIKKSKKRTIIKGVTKKKKAKKTKRTHKRNKHTNKKVYKKNKKGHNKNTRKK